MSIQNKIKSLKIQFCQSKIKFIKVFFFNLELNLDQFQIIKLNQLLNTNIKQFIMNLNTVQVWALAASQILFSLSVGFGSQLVLSSYNEVTNNCHRKFIQNFFITSYIGFPPKFSLKKIRENERTIFVHFRSKFSRISMYFQRNFRPNFGEIFVQFSFDKNRNFSICIFAKK